MKNRREFLTSAATGLTTALSAGRVLGANDRLTGAFIGVGVMGTENLKVAMEHGVSVGRCATSISRTSSAPPPWRAGKGTRRKK